MSDVLAQIVQELLDRHLGGIPFFDHIDDFREMILASTLEGREKALAKLLPHQRKDFDGLFRAMQCKPVTIRLLDPPLHEFLPHAHAEQAELAKKIGLTAEAIGRVLGSS